MKGPTVFKTSMAITAGPANFGPLFFAGEWQRGVATAAELGYDAVEVGVRDPGLPVLQDVARAVRDSGLVISAVATGQSYYNDHLCPTDPDPKVRATLLDRLKAIIDWAAPWGAYVFFGGVRGRLEGDPSTFAAQRQRTVELLRACAEYAQPRGVRLGLEPINRYETNYVNTVAEALQMIDEVGADNVLVLADTFHMNIEEVSLAGALRQAGTKLGYVHLADSNRLAAGQGHVDFYELAGVLRQMGYSGYISAEILPLPDSQTAAELAIKCFQSL